MDHNEGGGGGGGPPENPLVPVNHLSNPFDLLPDDALIHLLTFVDLTDPSNHGVLGVSSRFRLLCNSRRTKLVLNLDPHGEDDRENGMMSPAVARVFLAHCPRLRELEFGVQWGIREGPLAVHALGHCPNLTSLRGVHLGDDADRTKDVLAAIGERRRERPLPSSLLELELVEANFGLAKTSPEDVREAMRGLRIVAFRDCRGLRDDLLRAMGDGGGGDVADFTFESRGFLGIGKEAECHFIHRIGLSVKKLDLPDFTPCREFFAILGRRCKNLELLSVCSAERMGESELTSIVSLPRLKSLVVRRVWMPLFAAAFGGLKTTSTKLTRLDLSFSLGLNDASLAVVAEKCPDLEELDLTRCERLTDVGIRSVVTWCRKLRRLELRSISGLSRSMLRDLPDLEYMGQPFLEDEDFDDAEELEED